MYIKYIILSIINSITNLLPISYSSHIYLYQNLFNTKIFNDQHLINFLNLSIIIAIIFIHNKSIINFLLKTIKRIFKKDKKKFKVKLKFLNYLLISSILSTLINFFTPKIKYNINSIGFGYLLTAFILLLSTNKKGDKKGTDITIKDSILFSFSQILTIIPTISPLCANLFISKKLKFNQKNALKYSFLTILPIYFIKSINSIFYLYSNQEYLIFYIISLIISTIITTIIFNYFYSLYKNNKLYKLSIYCIFLSIFIFYWFR